VDIKNLKGSMSVADFAEGITVQKKAQTLGAVWEDIVTCDHCTYKEQCKAICSHYESKGIDLYCGQVIDYLLGEIDIETIPQEV
jgi:hypothetical protein